MGAIGQDPVIDRSGRPLSAPARDVLDRLAVADTAARGPLIDEAVQLAERLRREDSMEELARFADALRHHVVEADRAALVATLSAQALADLGQPFAARDVLRSAPAPSTGSDAWMEWHGLLGRTSKQIFLDAPDPSTEPAIAALDAALAAYLAAFEAAGRKATWHGVNVAALAVRARAIGRTVPDAADPATVARAVVEALEAREPRKRGVWWHASRAEAALAIDDLDAFARHVQAFVADEGTSTFALASFLRQLTGVWGLEESAVPELRALVALLQATLLRRRGAAMRVGAQQAASAEPPADRAVAALEKVFGGAAPKAIAWWELGLERARSVASICTTDPLGRTTRVGTGFLVPVADPQGAAPRALVLTNAHVIGDPAALRPAIRTLDRAYVRFEALAPARLHAVRRIAWTSDQTRHDATLLELDAAPEGGAPLPISDRLPNASSGARLYVIGHPLGQDLSFSFEDNELLDHEGPPDGRPARRDVVRLHYRTPTEPGSSGSPAFIEDRWQVVALHHSGRREMPRLNGVPGAYEANEGVSLASIAQALRAETGLELVLGTAAQPA